MKELIFAGSTTVVLLALLITTGLDIVYTWLVVRLNYIKLMDLIGGGYVRR